MVGGGAAHLNEILSMGMCGLSVITFADIKSGIGKWWEQSVW